MMQGYIRFRESGCVETLVQSEGLPDVLFSGVEGEHYNYIIQLIKLEGTGIGLNETILGTCLV